MDITCFSTIRGNLHLQQVLTTYSFVLWLPNHHSPCASQDPQLRGGVP